MRNLQNKKVEQKEGENKMALIELRHVKKEFSGKAGKVTALKDIDLTV